MNCGAFLIRSDLDYCPHCGSNVQVQKKVEYLSRLYYNRGLEKAEIRDLSGAITCLKISLMFNKANIQARNLLGLVYFETGEVVEALSQWVISKNLKPAKNLANEYIDKLQANPGKLEAINETIRKYNASLALCRKGHEDMAAIQLKKLLVQNPKLIKGYHLLALIQIKDKAWNKARRTLRKAARIDKTNTTTLRFLKEIELQTGVPTRVEKGKKNTKEQQKESGEIAKGIVYPSGNDVIIQPPVYKERSVGRVLLTLGIGFAFGAAALWFLGVPTIRQGIYREANQQIMDYSDYLVSQEAELSQVKGELLSQDNTQDTQQTQQQISAVQAKCNSYQALLAAYNAIQEGEPQRAAEYIQNVNPSMLSETARAIYESICSETGASGSESLYTDGITEDITDTLNAVAGIDSSNDTAAVYGADTSQEVYDQGTYDQGVYDQGVYDQGVYDQGVYDQGVYNQGVYDSGVYGY